MAINSTCSVFYNKEPEKVKGFLVPIAYIYKVSVSCSYLLIHLPLQLNDLVLHTRVELLQVFSRTSLNL